MQFEREQYLKKIDTWTALVDDSFGRHKDEVLSILRRATNPNQVVALIADYMSSEGGVTEIDSRDTAEKLGMKMPAFANSEEEVLWNFFMQIRSDQNTEE